MSALTIEDLEERFLDLARPVLDTFQKKIEALFNEVFADFTKQLEAKTRGSTSGFHKEKLNSLMDKLVNQMIIIKDNFISQLTAKVNRAIVEAENQVDITDSMMQSFIDEKSPAAMDACITLFKEESTQVIIEGLGELTLDDSVDPPQDNDYENSMSEEGDSLPEVVDSDVSDANELSETKSEQSEEVALRIPTGDKPKDKKKRKSIKLKSMISNKVKKTNSGNYRPVPGME